MSENIKSTETPSTETASNFIHDIINEENQSGKHDGRVATRFPPEPNGYLHIGHAKSICLNFGTAQKYGGTCNLRFDDTNPTKEDVEYVDSIQEDVHWLGFDWAERKYFASDYFEKLYEYAVELIKMGLAYVDEQNDEQISQNRGSFYKVGVDSPWRNRPLEESLDLFARMRAGEFADGVRVLRAKIDMAHPNMNMRDPLMYRIRHAEHHRTGNKWCIYPMYDYAHGICDAIEGITHSICTLEFEDHRPLYDWFLEKLATRVKFNQRAKALPRQIEFARLNLTYTIMSKRKLLQLVQENRVRGWNDPRMPTIAGMRRRGFTPEAVRNFAERIGVARRDSLVDVQLLEHCQREVLEASAPRVMGVLNPLKVVIENFPEGHVEWFDAPYFPEDASRGSRKVPLTREIFIERDDFREVPPKKWFRLQPGGEIRLRYACLIRCTSMIKDEASGEIKELRCTWDPESKGGNAPDGRKVKGTSHWVSANLSVPAQVRLYEKLFAVENPGAEGDFLKDLNPQSETVLTDCRLEPRLGEARPDERFQFERLGYFCIDAIDSRPGALVFNRIVSLKDSWEKIEKKLTAAG